MRFSKADHLLFRVSKETMIMGLMGIPNFPICFEISGVEHTVVLKTRVKSLEAKINKPWRQVGEQRLRDSKISFLLEFVEFERIGYDYTRLLFFSDSGIEFLSSPALTRPLSFSIPK